MIIIFTPSRRDVGCGLGAGSVGAGRGRADELGRFWLVLYVNGAFDGAENVVNFGSNHRTSDLTPTVIQSTRINLEMQ